MKKKIKKGEYIPGNNFRVWTIRVICHNRYGLKSELIDVIGKRYYEEFLKVGYIYEPVKMPDDYNEFEEQYKREWVASSFAYKRADELYLNTFYCHKLPATIKRSFWYQFK